MKKMQNQLEELKDQKNKRNERDKVIDQISKIESRKG